MMLAFVLSSFIFISFLGSVNSEDCQVTYFDEDSFVCTCDKNACGFIGQINSPTYGFYTQMSSSKDSDRFNVTVNSITNPEVIDPHIKISINVTKKLQNIIGFGGAFTDSTGININSLSGELEDILLRSYYSSDGLEYNIGRIPIGGTDFSTHPYSYDDINGDIDLEQWELTEEDYNFKIPFIRRAIEMSRRPLKFYGSPWAPPVWMKTNGEVNGKGGLLPEMRQPWANYFKKFLDAYSENGIDMWGLTIQNEPSMGYYNSHDWNACGFSAEEERDFLKEFLGPTLNSSGYSNVKIMIHDDNRAFLPKYPSKILSDDIANKYTSGIAVHGYTDDIIPPTVLDTLQNKYPDKFILYSETAAGIVSKKVKLGSWKRAEDYASNIIENLNHWVGGWTDWNMALDPSGGPNWSVLQLDSPIIVNADRNEFYKQPMFYAMGHFSKLIPSGSTVLGTSIKSLKIDIDNLDATSVITPDGDIVVVLLNKALSPLNVMIEDNEGISFNITLKSRSLHTIMYTHIDDSVDPNGAMGVSLNIPIILLSVICLFKFAIPQ